MKRRAALVSNHLYGPGGGAQAVLWQVRALHDLDFEVTLYSTNMVHPANFYHLGKLGVGVERYYKGCSYGYDLLLNIDHFSYETPLAKLNAAHIFHPHDASPAAGGRDNVPPEGYQLISANSQYTSHWCKEDWGYAVPWLYIPIGRHFRVGRKERQILHVSRFAAPQELADKGHIQLIRAFQWMCDTDNTANEYWRLGLAGPIEDQRYLANLQQLAQGYPIKFYTNLSDEELANLYAQAAFYWHATGATLPKVHGAQEHLGLTTLEAMASGCVPIVLGTGGQREIVMPEFNGILCADTQTIGRVTLELTNDMASWSLLSRNAVETARVWQDYHAFLGRMEAWLNGQPIPGLPAMKREVTKFKPGDVCAVIVAHDAAEMTAKFLASIYKTAPAIGQVIVVDNCSDEDIANPCVNLMAAYKREGDSVYRTARNLNYAGALNAALSQTDKPLLLALNNDMLCIGEGWLERLLLSMLDDVGIVGPKLIFPDGNLQHAGGTLDFNRPDVGYHRYFGQADQPAASQNEEVLFVTGAALLARRELWHWPDLAGGLGYEDTALCLETRQNGYKVMYEPSSVLVHFGGITRAKTPGTAVGESESNKNRDAFVDEWYWKIQRSFPWWRKLMGN